MAAYGGGGGGGGVGGGPSTLTPKHQGIGSGGVNTTPLSTLLPGVLTCCDSLRSSIAKNGMMAVGDIAATCGRDLDPHLDALIPVLLRRHADTSEFISDAAANALRGVCAGASGGRVVAALLNAADAGNANAKRHAAPWLRDVLLGSIGAAPSSASGGNSSIQVGEAGSTSPTAPINIPAALATLSGSLLERVVVASARYLSDGSAGARAAGRAVLNALLTGRVIDDRLLFRMLPEKLERSVRGALGLPA